MTNKERRLKEAKICREMRNEVLLNDESDMWIHRDGEEMSLGMAMDDVHEYIYASLNMDDNPLRHLRHHFPGFNWKFYEGVSRGKLSSILRTADYIWIPGLFIDEEIIVAQQIGRAIPRVLCYLSKTGEYSGWNRSSSQELSSLVPHVRFVMNGDDKGMDTIIK